MKSCIPVCLWQDSFTVSQSQPLPSCHAHNLEHQQPATRQPQWQTIVMPGGGVCCQLGLPLLPGASHGSWLCPLSHPVAAVHGLVWQDVNRNGLRASGEAGLPGVTVQLWQGTAVWATTTTDAAGQYAFPGVPPREYTVQVVSPPGQVFSPRDQGANDAVDSDVDPATGRSFPFTLVAGEDYAGPDAGLFQGLPLGGWVAELYAGINCFFLPFIGRIPFAQG